MNLDSVFRYNKKIESLNHEYNIILVKTLENQRDYFEEQINLVKSDKNEKLKNIQLSKALEK